MPAGLLLPRRLPLLSESAKADAGCDEDPEDPRQDHHQVGGGDAVVFAPADALAPAEGGAGEAGAQGDADVLGEVERGGGTPLLSSGRELEDDEGEGRVDEAHPQGAEGPADDDEGDGDRAREDADGHEAGPCDHPDEAAENTTASGALPVDVVDPRLNQAPCGPAQRRCGERDAGAGRAEPS